MQQTTSRAIINWSSFDIAPGEITQFEQPSSSSIALNRVTGSQNPSQILGTLNANGQVWIINPNGVMFGGNAQVNVAGLVATSADIDNNNFMAGNYTFNRPGNPTHDQQRRQHHHRRCGADGVRGAEREQRRAYSG